MFVVKKTLSYAKITLPLLWDHTSGLHDLKPIKYILLYIIASQSFQSDVTHSRQPFPLVSFASWKINLQTLEPRLG